MKKRNKSRIRNIKYSSTKNRPGLNRWSTRRSNKNGKTKCQNYKENSGVKSLLWLRNNRKLNKSSWNKSKNWELNSLKPLWLSRRLKKRQKSLRKRLKDTWGTNRSTSRKRREDNSRLSGKALRTITRSSKATQLLSPGASGVIPAHSCSKIFRSFLKIT